MANLPSGLNTMVYHWRRNRWLLDPRRFFIRYEDVPIRQPIFFVGNQGGGLTLISRMIRRHPDVVSISGDHRYWSGADEMQRVMELRLSPNLKLARYAYWGEPRHERLTRPRSWSYATDALLEGYRRTEADYNERDARKLRFLIREALHRHGRGDPNKRFTDKSQVFTVKMRFIQALLGEAEPYFVLITRNPYAACYRAALGKAIDMQRYAGTMSLDERVAYAAEHWANAIGCALEDGPHVHRFKVMRFEDFLRNPEPSLRDLCDFLGLSFDADMLPRPHHVIPPGSRFRDRWYPLKPDVNERYLRTISPRHVEMIAARCAPLADRLGYEPVRPAVLSPKR